MDIKFKGKIPWPLIVTLTSSLQSWVMEPAYYLPEMNI